MINKKNDWVATLLFQPDATLDDFFANNITPDNTAIQSKDYYEQIPVIQERFIDNEGKFDKTKFNDFYNQTLELYNTFAQIDFDNKIIDSFEYDPWDSASGFGRDKKDMSAKIELAPLGSQFETESIHNLGLISESDWSLEEMAQTQNVVDPETGKTLDWTPNDKGGPFKSFARPSLVYATWDEDGTHEFNGRVLKHSKGDWKFNENGLPYTELAGDRELYDKTFVVYSDTLTKEGTAINKYDFFDSDGLDKSVGGTIAKTVFSVAPYFIPGVNTAFGAIAASLQLAQLLPTFIKGVTGIVRGDRDSEFEKTLNYIENYTSRFKGDVSDKSKQHLVTFENFGNLIKDVSSQLFQQQVVGQIPRLFTKNNVEARNFGSKLALGYMAATSGKEAYAQFKQAGADDTAAGLGMLGTMAGLYGLMSQNYFRDFAAKGSFWDDSVVKDATKSVVQDFREGMFGKPVNQATATNFVQKVIQRFSDKSLIGLKEGAEKVVKTSNSFWNSALNEALEETSEEAIADVMKGLTAGLNALGFDMTEDDKQLDFGFSGKDMLQRYAMSFAGGFIGGPIFELHHRWDATLQKHLHGVMPKGLSEEFVYLIRNKRTNEILETLDNWHKKGKLGDPNRSGKNKTTVQSADGKTEEVWAAAEENESQNDLMYNVLTMYVKSLDNILSNEGLKLTDNDIKNVLNKHGDIIDDPLVNKVLNRQLDTAILQDWNTLSDQIIKTTIDLDAKLKELSEGQSINTVEEREAIAKVNKDNPEVIELKSKLDALRLAKENILSGKRTKYYIGQGLFVLDDETNKHFINLSLDNYTKVKYNRNFESLSDYQKKSVKEEHDIYLKTAGSQNLKKAYDYYLDFSQANAEEINKLKSELSSVAIDGGYSEKTLGVKWVENDQKIRQLKNQIEAIDSSVPENADKISELESQLLDLQIENSKIVQNGLGAFVLPDLQENVVFDRLRNLTLDTFITPELAQKEIDETAKQLSDFYSKAGVLKTGATLKREVTEFLKSAIKPLAKFNFYDPIVNWANAHRDELNDAEIDLELLSTWSNSVKELELNAGKNNDRAIEAYNEFIAHKQDILSYLSEIQNDFARNGKVPTIIEEFRNQIQTSDFTINGKSFSDFILETDNLIQTAVQSPIKAFLDKVSTNIKGKTVNLIDIIDAEENSLLSKKNWDEYVIESPTIEHELEEASQLLHVVEALVNGGYNNLNSIINKVPGSGITSLGELDEHSGQVITSYFTNLKWRLGFLKALHDVNKLAALNVQKDIAFNNVKNQLQFFVNEFENLGLISTLQLGENWKDDINNILNKYNITLDDPAKSDYSNLEQAKVEIESLLYKTIDFHNKSDKVKFIKDIVSSMGSDLYKLDSGSLSTESKLTNYTKLMYLLSVIGLDAKQFYNKYKQITLSDEFKFAPIASQEFSVRLGYNFYLNPDMIKTVNDAILEMTPDKETYLKAKSLLNNMYFILGGAGTGKTTCCDYILSKMITSDRSKIYAVAPSSTLANKLATDVDTENKMTKNDLLSYVYGDDYNPTYILDQNNHKVSDAKTKFKPLKDGAVILIDEVTFYSESELKDIDNWAQTYGYFIIGSGDLKQNGLLLKLQGKNGEFALGNSGLEDCIFVSGPELSTSLRADNQAKFRNAQKLDKILYDAWQQIKANSLQEQFGKDFIKNTVAKLELVYTQTDDGLFGEKLINETGIENNLKKLLSYVKDPSQIVLITDNDKTKSKYQSLANNITILQPDQVQGSDFEYAIIDLDNITNGEKSNNFGALRNLYTLTQRSRRGTLIVEKEDAWSKILNLSTISVVDGAAPLNITEDSINKFKEFRNESLSKIVTDDSTELVQNRFVVKPQEIKDEEPEEKEPEEKEPEEKEPEEEKKPQQKPKEIKEESKKVNVTWKNNLGFNKPYFLTFLQENPKILNFANVFLTEDDKKDSDKQKLRNDKRKWIITISDLVFNNNLKDVKIKLKDWVREERISENTELGKLVKSDFDLKLRFDIYNNDGVLSLELISDQTSIKIPIGFSKNCHLEGRIKSFDISRSGELRTLKTSQQVEGRQSIEDFENSTGAQILGVRIFRDMKDATNPDQIDWAERSNGKPFAIVTNDLSLDIDVNTIWNSNDINQSFINKHPNVALVGLQAKTNFQDLIKYCNTYVRAGNGNVNINEFYRVYKNLFGEHSIINFTKEGLFENRHKLFPLNEDNADKLLAKIILNNSSDFNVNMFLSPNARFQFKIDDVDIQFERSKDGTFRILNNPNFTQTFNSINEVANAIQMFLQLDTLDDLKFQILSKSKKDVWYTVPRLEVFNKLFSTHSVKDSEKFDINWDFVNTISNTIAHAFELNLIDKIKNYNTPTGNWYTIDNYSKDNYSIIGQLNYPYYKIGFIMEDDATATFVGAEERLKETVQQISPNAAAIAQNEIQTTNNVTGTVEKVNQTLQQNGQSEKIVIDPNAPGDSEFNVQQQTLQEQTMSKILRFLYQKHKKELIKNLNIINTKDDWKIGLVFVTLGDDSKVSYIYNINAKPILNTTLAGEMFQTAWTTHQHNQAVLNFLHACLDSSQMTDEIVNKYLESSNKNENLINEFLKMQLENHEC